VHPRLPLFTTTYIVPAHNSVGVLEGTLTSIRQRLAAHAPAEVIVVENGSSDGTPELLEKAADQWATQDDGVVLNVLTTEKGLGNALREGIIRSRGERLVLTADDLPFDFDEFDAAADIDVAQCRVVIGSKDHCDSVVGRTLGREILTGGFKLLRRIILGMRTGDPQGTYVLDGPWARSVAPVLRQPGFLFTTEFTYVAELAGLRPVEVPVRLRRIDPSHRSRIRPSDPVKMGIGLFELRLRRRAYRNALRATAAPTGRR
jgi:glycosyltransferase involved in cell wall biosynthesis